MPGNFKRGAFRGGGSGGFKTASVKKRSAEDDTPRASKRSKGSEDEEDETAPVVPKLQTDDEENSFVALNHSGKRRVTVSDFKGTPLISIREYWTNDGGELKPGKKGIALTIEQYNALVAAAPLLESILRSKNIQVARPNYTADFNAAELAKEGEGEGEAKEEGKLNSIAIDDDGEDEA